jgi:hypothetical protein
MPGEPDQLNFRRDLDGVQFRHVTPPRDECAHIRFTGRFRGKDVIWDATVLTLTYYYRCHSGGNSTTKLDHVVRQFIEVGKPAGNIHRLVVALNVPQIDVPALLKTIIMIRKYKHLAIGRHEYGPAWRPR